MAHSRGTPSDTSEEATTRYFELLRKRSPAERRAILAGLVASVRKLAESGVRAAYPDASDREVNARVAARIYGSEVAERLFGRREHAMSAGAEDPIGIALRVAAAIESAGGSYFVGGSVASSLHGDPRSTNDIDFIVSLPLGHIDAFVAALGVDFELDRDMLRDALRQARCANGFYLPVLTKIDIFGLGVEPFDEAEFARRGAVVVGNAGESLVVKSPEDSILRKLLWYRDGGEVSDRQWRDVVSILRVNAGRLDLSYLLEWAKRLHCSDLLAKAQAAADPATR